jgi:hypothetical protein
VAGNKQATRFSVINGFRANQYIPAAGKALIAILAHNLFLTLKNKQQDTAHDGKNTTIPQL